MEVTFRTVAAEESIRSMPARFPEGLLEAGTWWDGDQVPCAWPAGGSGMVEKALVNAGRWDEITRPTRVALVLAQGWGRFLVP